MSFRSTSVRERRSLYTLPSLQATYRPCLSSIHPSLPPSPPSRVPNCLEPVHQDHRSCPAARQAHHLRTRPRDKPRLPVSRDNKTKRITNYPDWPPSLLAAIHEREQDRLPQPAIRPQLKACPRTRPNPQQQDPNIPTRFVNSQPHLRVAAGRRGDVMPRANSSRPQHSPSLCCAHSSHASKAA